MDNVKIGDTVQLVSRFGNVNVIVTDVIRDMFGKEPIALEFVNKAGETVNLPIKFFAPV